MSLTRAQMDWLDEQPTRRQGGFIYSFAEAGNSRELRSRTPRFPRLEARKRRLVLLTWTLAKEER